MAFLPGLAEGVRHVHFELKGPGREHRMIALNLGRHDGAGSDTTFARLPQLLTLPGNAEWV